MSDQAGEEPLRIEVTNEQEIEVRHGEGMSQSEAFPLVMANVRGKTRSPARMPVDVAVPMTPDKAEEVGVALIAEAHMARLMFPRPTEGGSDVDSGR